MLAVSLAVAISPLSPLRGGSRLKGFQWKWKRCGWHDQPMGSYLPFRLKAQKQAAGKLRGFLVQVRIVIFDLVKNLAYNTRCGYRLGSPFRTLKRFFPERIVGDEQVFALEWTRVGTKRLLEMRVSCCCYGSKGYWRKKWNWLIRSWQLIAGIFLMKKQAGVRNREENTEELK